MEGLYAPYMDRSAKKESLEYIQGNSKIKIHENEKEVMALHKFAGN